MIWEDDILTQYMGSTSSEDDSVESTYVYHLGTEVEQPGTSYSYECVLHRERTGERIMINPPAIIGRGRQANVKLTGNLAISRTHAKLQVAQGRLYIIDLGSVNGTRVRGERIAPQVPVVVQNGDEIFFASEQFRLYVREQGSDNG